jgi:uncharacterized Zn finger protein (UPF0148 family)
MSEPEISRRCPECGASIRMRAFFCPQCGHAFVQEASEAKPVPDSGEKQKPNAADAQGVSAEKESESSDVRDDLSAGGDGLPAEHHSKVSVHRATAAARDVFEDNVLPRVERLRHVSSVVLDEAGYDPSLRFVLVAVVLFVLFLVLLLLSKWLG